MVECDISCSRHDCNGGPKEYFCVDFFILIFLAGGGGGGERIWVYSVNMLWHICYRVLGLVS